VHDACRSAHGTVALRRRGTIENRHYGTGLARTGKLILVGVLAAAVAVFFALDLSQYATLEYLKSVHEDALTYVHTRPLLSSVAYFVIYVLVTGLSLPGAAVSSVSRTRRRMNSL